MSALRRLGKRWVRFIHCFDFCKGRCLSFDYLVYCCFTPPTEILTTNTSGREPHAEREQRMAYDEVYTPDEYPVGSRQSENDISENAMESNRDTITILNSQYIPFIDNITTCGSDVLLATLVICLGGGIAFWLHSRRKNSADIHIRRITKCIHSSVRYQLEERKEKVPSISDVEAAATFIEEELQNKADQCDAGSVLSNDKLTAVPSRRLIQEAEFYSEFIEMSTTKTLKLRRKLNLRGFSLLSHCIAGVNTELGVSYYMAYSASHQVVVVSLIGQEDPFILIESLLSQLHQPNAPYLLNDSTRVCHKQVATCAQQLVSEVRGSLIDLFVCHNYQVVLVGHSQNASIAALSAILLKEECGIKNVKACCIAPPPCLDKESSYLCRSYVTSVVHHSDMGPRVSVSALVSLASLISKVSNSLCGGGPIKTRSILKSIMRDAQSVKPSPTSQSSGCCDTELSVPGSVVYVYYNATGVHSAALLQRENNLSVIQNINLTKSMITDHTAESYDHSLRQLLARLPPDDPTWHWCGPTPPTRGLTVTPS